MIPLAALVLVSLFPAHRVDPEGDEDVPVELGRVSWQRNRDAAFQRAKASGKPVLLLFQEIPG